TVAYLSTHPSTAGATPRYPRAARFSRRPRADPPAPADTCANRCSVADGKWAMSKGFPFDAPSLYRARTPGPLLSRGGGEIHRRRGGEAGSAVIGGVHAGQGDGVRSDLERDGLRGRARIGIVPLGRRDHGGQAHRLGLEVDGQGAIDGATSAILEGVSAPEGV